MNWSVVPPVELADSVGSIGRISEVELSESRLQALRSAVSRASADQAQVSLADYCPDPLVFALESGLPRLRVLDRTIDGGSEWTQLTELELGTLTAVPRISEIAERTSSAGRRIIRSCYETEFRTARGALVGWARGFSLDVSGDAL